MLILFHVQLERNDNMKGPDGMDVYSLIIPLGILAFVSVLFNVLTGTRVIRLRPPKRHMAIHKLVGFVALAVAALHGLLVIYTNYF